MRIASFQARTLVIPLKIISGLPSLMKTSLFQESFAGIANMLTRILRIENRYGYVHRLNGNELRRLLPIVAAVPLFRFACETTRAGEEQRC